MKLIIHYLCLTFHILTALQATEVSNGESAEEIQHATCKIVTKDIQANASATVVRQLNNVCTSSELKQLFKDFEDRLFTELEIIKKALIVPLEENVQIKSLNNLKVDKTINNSMTDNPIAKKKNIEASKYNMTFSKNSLNEKVFMYYWKIHNSKNVLALSETYLDSSTIFMSGFTLTIRLHLHHLGSEYICLQLLSTNNTHYLSKHRFIILNQKYEEGDLTSQILGENAGMFRVSYKKILNGDFTLGDILLIKLMVFF